MQSIPLARANSLMLKYSQVRPTWQLQKLNHKCFENCWRGNKQVSATWRSGNPTENVRKCCISKALSWYKRVFFFAWLKRCIVNTFPYKVSMSIKPVLGSSFTNQTEKVRLSSSAPLQISITQLQWGQAIYHSKHSRQPPLRSARYEKPLEAPATPLLKSCMSVWEEDSALEHM